MRGGGNSIRTDANGYLVGRIGLPRSKQLWVGLSGLNGEAESAGDIIQRQRTAIDMGLRLGHGLTILSELAYGDEANEEIRHAMAEIGWNSLRETTFAYFQLREIRYPERPDNKKNRRFTLGARYEPNNSWSGSIEIQRHQDIEHHTECSLQLRYRW